MMIWNGTKKGARRPRPAYRRALDKLAETLILSIVIGIGIIAVFELGYGLGMAGGSK